VSKAANWQHFRTRTQPQAVLVLVLVRMSLPIEYEYEYRFTEYEYEFDALDTGDEREVMSAKCPFLQARAFIWRSNTALSWLLRGSSVPIHVVSSRSE
jgi:hypothetical protein